MKIAVEGCAHGELDKIYEALALLEKTNAFKVDLLICCGDFQAVRNLSDLRCMAVSDKYREMNTFYKYYSGEKVAPVLTLFIGGNHEASNYMAELAYGGWVCPNIYYIGYSNVVTFGGLRIAGLSGIYKGPDYLKGHFEIPPYNGSTLRSAYHIRSIDVFRLKQMSKSIDIFLSHDWPRGIGYHGDLASLLRMKPFLKRDIESDSLGSRPALLLLETIQPEYWFAAHLHVKFAALFEHKKDGECERFTKFLALDKCLPRRDYMQVLDIPHDQKIPLELRYDVEWLCVLRSTNHLLSVSNRVQYMPGPGCQERWDFKPTAEELEQVRELFQGDFTIGLDFERTVRPYSPEDDPGSYGAPFPTTNPQTTRFCRRLRVDDPMELLLGPREETSVPVCAERSAACSDMEMNVTMILDKSRNPEELDLDEEEEVVMKEKEELRFPEYCEEKKMCSSERSEPLKKFKRRNESIYGERD